MKCKVTAIFEVDVEHIGFEVDGGEDWSSRVWNELSTLCANSETGLVLDELGWDDPPTQMEMEL